MSSFSNSRMNTNRSSLLAEHIRRSSASSSDALFMVAPLNVPCYTLSHGRAATIRTRAGCQPRPSPSSYLLPSSNASGNSICRASAMRSFRRQTWSRPDGTPVNAVLAAGRHHHD